MNQKAPKYNGVVKITMKCINDTNQIVLHTALTKNTDLVLKSLSEPGHANSDKVIRVTKINYNPVKEMVAYTTEKNLTRGMEYTLLIAFERRLRSKDADGFFLTTYLDGKAERQ